MKTLRFLLPILLLLLMQACDDNNQVAEKRKEAPTEMFMDKGDIQFAVDAAKANLAEIELGKLAVKSGSDKRIKNFGAQLVKSHTKRQAKLQPIVVKKKISLPAADTALNTPMASLSKNTGKAFDRAYLDFMMKDHAERIKLFTNASKTVVDADLRKYATQNLLIFKRHLDALNGIQSIVR